MVTTSVPDNGFNGCFWLLFQRGQCPFFWKVDGTPRPHCLGRMHRVLLDLLLVLVRRYPLWLTTCCYCCCITEVSMRRCFSFYTFFIKHTPSSSSLTDCCMYHVARNKQLQHITHQIDVVPKHVSPPPPTTITRTYKSRDAMKNTISVCNQLCKLV